MGFDFRDGAAQRAEVGGTGNAWRSQRHNHAQTGPLTP